MNVQSLKINARQCSIMMIKISCIFDSRSPEALVSSGRVVNLASLLPLNVRLQGHHLWMNVLNMKLSYWLFFQGEGGWKAKGWEIFQHRHVRSGERICIGISIFYSIVWHRIVWNWWSPIVKLHSSIHCLKTEENDRNNQNLGRSQTF